MKTHVTSFAQKAWNDFRGFPVGQQIVVGIAIAALVIGGAFYTMWAPGTTYAPLFTNLAPTDASAIIDKLNSTGTPYQLAAAGTEVDVPKDKVYEARLAVSAAGLPASGQTGYSLLDKEGVTTSDFKQQVDYQRAVEGELAKTIMSIQGVTGARVQLAIPQQNVFNDNSSDPTASVLLTLNPGLQMTSQQVQSVVYLVSNAIPNMQAKDVAVSDSAGNVLSAPGAGVTDTAATATQTQATTAYEDRIQTQLEAMIARVLGPNRANVTVTAALDFNKQTTKLTLPTYNKSAPPLSTSDTTESYSGGATPGGTLGSTTSNGTPSGGSGNYKKSTKVVNNSVGTETRVTENAPGQLQNLNISVALDAGSKAINAASIAKIQQLIKSGIGFNAARGDQLSVQALAFDTSQQAADVKAAAAAAAAAKSAQAHDELMGMIKQGAIVLVVLLVVLFTWLSSRKRAKAAAAAADDEDDDDVLDDDVVITRGPAAAVHQQASEDNELMIAEMQEAAARRRAFISLAEEQPDDVARVLSGWLN